MTEFEKNVALENIEVELFLQALKLKHGYDYHDYSQASLKRRLRALKEKMGVSSISGMIPELIHNEKILEDVIDGLSVTMTDMFRDPEVFLQIREQLLPVLRSYPRINIWVAGCATGEEIYSLAILLHEEELLSRSRIYATDVNSNNLKKAESGIFSLDKVPEYTRNYQAAGGKSSFSDYYHARYSNAIVPGFLRERIVFSEHNLAVDGRFGEMHLIMCRNVLIYFNKELQNKALTLFNDSLIRGGFLCLGTKESLRAINQKEQFRTLSEQSRIYQKLSPGAIPLQEFD